jgi:glucokinase
MIAIGIDIGGTFVKFFAVNDKRKIIKRDKIPTYNTLTANAFLTQLSDIVNEWKKEFKGKKVVLGVGLPGDTDHIKGVLRWAPNIPWHNLKVKDVLTKKTLCPCYVSNDANMAAWGVYAKELGAKYKDLIIVTMGTGIGGGLIINGDLYQGATGSAGELGHMKVDFSPEAPLCGCGQRGCLEAFAGTKGIRRVVEAAAVEHPKSILASLLKTEDFSVNLLSIAAAGGDGVAIKLWEDIGRQLGRGIANMTLLLNPQAVVLAGGVSRGAQHFMRSMGEVFKDQSVKTPFKYLKILLSQEGNIGGVGAALYALSRTNEK